MKKQWFRRIMRLFRFQNVRDKYFIAMISLSLPPLFLLGFFSYNIAKDTLVQNQLRVTENHLETANEVADLLLRNIINMERVISWNKDIQRELKRSASHKDSKQKIINMGTVRRIQNLLSNYLIDTQDIDSVCLFDPHYRSVCYGNSKSMGHYGSNDNFAEIAQTDWYKRSVEAKGKPVFFDYNVLTDTRTSNTFSSVKLLRDPEQLFHPQITGLLVVNIKKSIFLKVFNEKENRGFIVLNPSRKGVSVVYDSTSSFHIESNLGNSISSAFQKLRDRGYFLSSYTNQTTGWMFIHVIKEKELLQQPNQIGMVTAFIASFMALISLFLSFVFSGSITRPLRQLKKITVELAKGIWDVHDATEENEIVVIEETFKRMTKENQKLNEQLIRLQLKEREAELRALQAQIKPHFLYNTLDSIYWMAVLQNNHDIAKMAISLSESFKLSLNNGKEFIPVAKELEHIQHYMTIQNMRHNNRFQYIQKVDPALMDKEILKLLLQPLVENAIYHGLEPKVGKGTVRLTGKIESGFIIFTIEDDGVGMEDLEAIEKGYGLRNVRERLALYYGADSRFTISSEVNRGTRVEIRFPMETKEGNP
ncbi:cache domain-containing sensor histidine kinase [Saccharococcus caldoxylosilyticus]|uniref:cache domain-containing sensor histidine kinase n=1 Tax=Saccharococcus caldoxylosilyticus TaxID=81408 RepID=UPI000524D176|nr:sensor histidine kinase [Parageobacillus caldoxylosilyticus]